MMSFVKNLTEYSVGTESFEFSVIPIGFNHNSREMSGNPIGFTVCTEIIWGMLKLTEITKTEKYWNLQKGKHSLKLKFSFSFISTMNAFSYN